MWGRWLGCIYRKEMCQNACVGPITWPWSSGSNSGGTFKGIESIERDLGGYYEKNAIS